jgi:hypothetical protein
MVNYLLNFLIKLAVEKRDLVESIIKASFIVNIIESRVKVMVAIIKSKLNYYLG